MLRPRRATTSILPNHGGDCSSNNYYGGYRSSSSSSSSFSGYGSHTSTSYGEGIYSKKRRNSYTSPHDLIDIIPTFIKKSSSWFALALVFFVLLAGYYQSKFQYILRELKVDSLDQLVQTYQDLYTERSRKQQRGFGEVDERYAMLERLNAKLHKEKEELRKSYEKKVMKEFTARREEEGRLIAREQAFKEQIKRLQVAASRDAKRAVTDK